MDYMVIYTTQCRAEYAWRELIRDLDSTDIITEALKPNLKIKFKNGDNLYFRSATNYRLIRGFRGQQLSQDELYRKIEEIKNADLQRDAEIKKLS